jgi:hypothetical protein
VILLNADTGSIKIIALPSAISHPAVYHSRNVAVYVAWTGHRVNWRKIAITLKTLAGAAI